MRSESSLLPGAAVLATGIFLVASIFLSPDFARAGEPASSGSAVTADPSGAPMVISELSDDQAKVPSCSCPQDSARPAKPKFAGLNAGLNGGALDESDEVAALASVHQALNMAGDGQAYVWQRTNGHLSGLIRPVSSFRNDEGQICRHIIVMLTTGARTEKLESTACRLAGGRWQLGD